MKIALLMTMMSCFPLHSRFVPDAPKGMKVPSTDELLKTIGSNADTPTRLAAITELQSRRILPSKLPSVLLKALADSNVAIRAATAHCLAGFPTSGRFWHS